VSALVPELSSMFKAISSSLMGMLFVVLLVLFFIINFS
jgi:hypothetical protein